MKATASPFITLRGAPPPRPMRSRRKPLAHILQCRAALRLLPSARPPPVPSILPVPPVLPTLFTARGAPPPLAWYAASSSLGPSRYALGLGVSLPLCVCSSASICHQ